MSVFTEFEEKSGVYFLFSRLFREAPDLFLLKEIVEGNLLDLIRSHCEEAIRPTKQSHAKCHPERSEGSQRFFGLRPQNDRNSEIASLPGVARNDGSACKTASSQFFEKIAVEYTSLFVAPGECSIPPYESFYCDTLTIDTSTANSPYFQAECMPCGMKGFVYGSSARAVEKAYRQSGFELDPKFHDLPDHVACELEFVGWLYQGEKAEVVQPFFENHLGRWVSLFLSKLREQKRSIFYQTVARSLECFLEHECVFRASTIRTD